ncbi:hypothetical protein [Mucilaginibacter sp. BT774]|uniref:hypothetical protein n=1 Tax=Mucilaginibacter sp. BT774 TaxID=3062276 RepID=UPI002676170E|nr:hypothetical protein [Mucilaginibacter sp. BT774]MDO3627002.1 hypothetical protein [Mucilaginibacter sp. BT774]
MKALQYISVMLIVILVVTGCYYDHADLVYPQPTNCLVSNITYSSSVVGILQTNCYSCHSGSASAGGGIKLDNYTSLKIYVTNGQLMNSINHTGGIPAMPLSGSQLSACDILTIKTWINNGTPNN